jgi:uncharacterized protein YbjT (DUF2867 family)
MKKVILFGSTGHLGKKIAEELIRQRYAVTAVIRHPSKAAELASLPLQTQVADVTDAATLTGICDGFAVVVSALGKSVSLNERSKPSFRDIDLDANTAILKEAVKSKVQTFIYVSALGAEKYPHLQYFHVHHLFSERLKSSGINYGIIKPPALFSAFLDLIDMAKKGQLVTLGKGDKLANPIYEGDLAKLCVAAIEQPNVEVEAGGKEVLNRHQLNEQIQQAVNPTKKVRKIPLALVKAGLPLVKLASQNLFDKMAFFVEVMQHDTIAPPVGDAKLADYIRHKVQAAIS